MLFLPCLCKRARGVLGGEGRTTQWPLRNRRTPVHAFALLCLLRTTASTDTTMLLRSVSGRGHRNISPAPYCPFDRWGGGTRQVCKERRESPFGKVNELSIHVREQKKKLRRILRHICRAGGQRRSAVSTKVPSWRHRADDIFFTYVYVVARDKERGAKRTQTQLVGRTFSSTDFPVYTHEVIIVHAQVHVMKGGGGCASLPFTRVRQPVGSIVFVF